MSLSDERVQEFKDIYKKKYDKEISDSEARDSAERLVGFFDLLWKFSQEESRREGRLKNEPDGFPVEGNYSCLVCGNSINPTTGWYHWGGPRCLVCHKAIQDGVIPFFVLKCHDSYYKMWQLKDKFKAKSHQAVKKLIKEGVLKARLVMNGEHVHEYIFFKKRESKSC